jgi:hypothetical protein
MSAKRITRREMLKRLIVAPIGAAVLTTLEVRQASAATMQPYYAPYFVAVLWEGRTRCDSLWRSLKGRCRRDPADRAGRNTLRPPLLDGLRAGQRACECGYARAGRAR